MMVDWSENVLKADFVDEYMRGMQFFYSHLVELHTNIFILEKVLAFPFRLFAGPDHIFFRQVIINFYDVSILTITRVAADQDGDLFTLPHFKNAIVQHIKDTHREPFQKQLRVVRFDEETKELLAKAKTIRNQRIAHITQQFTNDFFQRPLEQLGFNLGELRTLRDRITALFQALAINATYRMLPIGYDTDTSHSDIEHLLDNIADKSPILRMPEQQSEFWQTYRLPTLTDAEKEQINLYRRKFGLTPIE
jgi:hypothetical protein